MVVELIWMVGAQDTSSDVSSEISAGRLVLFKPITKSWN